MTIRERDFSRHREAPSRRRALGLLASTPLLLPGQGGAQTDWPSKPVRVVSPSTGGITDTHCRIVFEALQERLGQRFYVDGKPGAGGGISAQIAARSPADGYTLLFCIASLIVTNPYVYAKLLYDIDRDFDPVALLAWAPFAILARESLPVRSMPELAEHIRAHPGKVTFANVAPGSLAHLVGEQWIQKIGGRAEMIPYRSVPQTMLALSSGEMDVFVAPIGEAKAGIAGGKIRGLGVTTAKRLEALPDVPTLEEQGYPGFDVAGWYGVLAPKGTTTADCRKAQPRAQCGDCRSGLSRACGRIGRRRSRTAHSRSFWNLVPRRRRALEGRDRQDWAEARIECGVEPQLLLSRASCCCCRCRSIALSMRITAASTSGSDWSGNRHSSS